MAKDPGDFQNRDPLGQGGRGEGVPERMDVLQLDPRLAANFYPVPPHVVIVPRIPALCNKQEARQAGYISFMPQLPDPVQRLVKKDGDVPVAGPGLRLVKIIPGAADLGPADVDLLVVKINVLKTERAQFADPHPGHQQQIKEGIVPAPPIVTFQDPEQAEQLRESENGNLFLGNLRGLDGVHRVPEDPPGDKRLFHGSVEQLVDFINRSRGECAGVRIVQRLNMVSCDLVQGKRIYRQQFFGGVLGTFKGLRPVLRLEIGPHEFNDPFAQGDAGSANLKTVLL